MTKKILKGVSDYYTEKINIYGNTSKGVDWNSKDSQYLRFTQLSKIIDMKAGFSILDFGCGYGEYLNFLQQNYPDFDIRYYGFDVSEKMIEEASKIFTLSENVNFFTAIPKVKSNYVIASGIFNVRLNFATEKDWLMYMLDTLNEINLLSEYGFAFNALTSYSDKEFMKDYLFYADPLFIFDFCKKNFSRNVALLHDYNLYEFTILVKK